MNKFLNAMQGILTVGIVVGALSLFGWLTYSIGAMMTEVEYERRTVMKDHVCSQVVINDNNNKMVPWNIIPVEGYKLYSCKENHVH